VPFRRFEYTGFWGTELTNTPDPNQIADLFTQLTEESAELESQAQAERDVPANVAPSTSSPAMRLESLQITNLWSYDHTDIKFENGITVIAGMNGSGKSSLLESIFFALYGSKAGPAMDRSLADVLRIGSDIGAATLKFQFGPHHYTSQMSLRRRGDNVISEKEACKLVRNDGADWVGVEVATSAVEELFGMNRDDFTNCVYVRQGEIDRLIRAGGKERRDMIDRLLRLEKLDAYARRSDGGAKTALNRHVGGLEKLAIKNRTDLKQLQDEGPEKRLGKVENEMKAQQAELKTLDEKLDKAKGLKSEQLQELKRLEDLRRALESNSQNLKRKENQLRDHEARSEQITKALEDLKDKHSTAQSQLEELSARLELPSTVILEKLNHVTAWNEIELLSGNLSEVSTRQEEVQRQADTFQREQNLVLEKHSEKSTSQAVVLKEVENNLQHLNRELKKICDLVEQGKCPECGQPLDGGDFSESILAKQSEISKLEAEIEDLKKENDKQIEKIEKLKSEQNAQMEQLRDDYKSLDQRKKSLEQAKELVQSLLQIQREAADKRESLKTTREMSESLKDEIASLKKSHSENEQKIQNVAEIEERSKKIDAVIDELNVERTKLQSKIEALIHEQGVLKNKIELFNKLTQESEQISTQLAEGKKLQEELGDLSTFYGDLKTELRKENIKALEHYFNTFFRVMDSGASYSGVKIDSDYDIVVELKSGDSIRPELLSGGERALINIALRSAIHQVLSQATSRMPLILDEPTIYLDRDRIIQLQHLLEELGSRIGQVIVVSHEAGLVENADHEYRTEKRADNTSHIVKVR